MTGTEVKRVKDLTDSDIDAFTKDDVLSWMKRIMNRLHQTIDRDKYDAMAAKLIQAANRSLKEIKNVLKQAVDSIRLKPVPAA